MSELSKLEARMAIEMAKLRAEVIVNQSIALHVLGVMAKHTSDPIAFLARAANTIFDQVSLVQFSGESTPELETITRDLAEESIAITMAAARKAFGG